MRISTRGKCDGGNPRGYLLIASVLVLANWKAQSPMENDGRRGVEGTERHLGEESCKSGLDRHSIQA